MDIPSGLPFHRAKEISLSENEIIPIRITISMRHDKNGNTSNPGLVKKLWIVEDLRKNIKI